MVSCPPDSRAKAAVPRTRPSSSTIRIVHADMKISLLLSPGREQGGGHPAWTSALQPLRREGVRGEPRTGSGAPSTERFGVKTNRSSLDAVLLHLVPERD